MKRFVSGFLAGATSIAALVLVFQSIGFDFGRHMGQLDGRAEAMEAIRSEFGEAPWSPGFKALFTMKTSVAVACVVDGVRTIRVVP